MNSVGLKEKDCISSSLNRARLVVSDTKIFIYFIKILTLSVKVLILLTLGEVGKVDEIEFGI